VDQLRDGPASRLLLIRCRAATRIRARPRCFAPNMGAPFGATMPLFFFFFFFFLFFPPSVRERGGRSTRRHANRDFLFTIATTLLKACRRVATHFTSGWSEDAQNRGKLNREAWRPPAPASLLKVPGAARNPPLRYAPDHDQLFPHQSSPYAARRPLGSAEWARLHLLVGVTAGAGSDNKQHKPPPPEAQYLRICRQYRGAFAAVWAKRAVEAPRPCNEDERPPAFFPLFRPALPKIKLAAMRLYSISGHSSVVAVLLGRFLSVPASPPWAGIVAGGHRRVGRASPRSAPPGFVAVHTAS